MIKINQKIQSAYEVAQRRSEALAAGIEFQCNAHGGRSHTPVARPATHERVIAPESTTAPRLTRGGAT